MRHITETEGYDDRTLADDVSCGFSLVGEVPQSHVLPEKLLPATTVKLPLSPPCFDHFFGQFFFWPEPVAFRRVYGT